MVEIVVLVVSGDEATVLDPARLLGFNSYFLIITSSWSESPSERSPWK